MKDVSYLTVKDMFPIDSFKAKTTVPVVYGRGSKWVYKDAYVQYDRAVYSDLDELYYFLLKYNEMYNFAEYHPEEYVRELLSNYFEFGCIVFARRNKNTDIAIVILSMFENVLHTSPLKDGDAEIVNLGWGVKIFISPDIGICGVYKTFDGARYMYSSDLYRTYLYVASLSSVLSTLTNSLNLDSSVSSIQIYMPSEDPRSYYVMSSLIEHNWPKKDYSYKIVRDALTNMYEGHILNVNMGKDVLVCFADPEAKEGFVKMGRRLYDLLVGSNLFKRWEEKYLPYKHIFLHEFAGKHKLSLVDTFNVLVETGTLRFFDGNGDDASDVMLSGDYMSELGRLGLCKYNSTDRKLLADLLERKSKVPGENQV